MSGRKLKGAALEESYFESDEVVACFNDITEPLNKELQHLQLDISLTSRDLSLLIGQIQRFQQDCLGAFNRPNHAPVRIPAKLLKVSKNTRLTVDLPIYTILLSAYTYRIKHNWKKWDFNNPARKQKNADLMQSVRKALIKKDLISIPKIAIAEVINDAYKKTILNMIKRVGAIFVEDKEEATHILHGKLHEYNKQGPEEDWFRTLEKDGPLVLVHWWYYPDSFDSWLPQTEQFADPEEPPEHTGPWKISVRWLQDTERFNEFMNEEDYEDLEEEEDEEDEEEEDEEKRQETVDETINSQTPRKRKASQSVDASNDNIPNTRDTDQPEISMPTISTPMEITEEEEGSEVPLVPLLRPGSHPEVRVRDIESEKPQANTRPRKNEFEPYLHGDIANISQYTATNVEYAKRPTKIQKIEKADSDNKALDVPSLIQKTPYDYDDLFMPEWFDRSSIHRLEALSIPEINDEDCSLTPDDYIAIRNYMIDAYRASPAYYLTISTCTSKLETDLPILVRIHSFLEMYGLINSHVDPRRRIYDPYIDTDPNAELKPKSQRNFADIDKADMQYLRDLIYKHDSSGHSHWKLSVEDPKNSDRRRIFICCTCRTDCSAVRYQSLKAKDYQVCIDCFLEGRYSAVYSSADFLRVEGTGGSAELEMDEQQPWSDQEILRLLEGVDRYDDDWLMISEHVGSRSKEQCITQFLQLPINDEFLTATLSEEELVETPFDDTTNPVMMMISFLAAHINPGIAAAASKAALKILIESDESHDNKNKEQLKVEDGANDSMDVNSTEDATKEKMDNIKTDEDDVYEESKIDDIKANNANKGVFSKETIRRATMGALNCAVQKAGKLADYEHQEIQHWTRLAVKTMVDKLSLKVGQYEELETSLLNEAQELEKQQSQIANSIEALRTPKDDHQQQLQQQDHNK